VAPPPAVRPVVVGPVERVLTLTELDRVRARIEATSSTEELVRVVLVEVYRVLRYLDAEEVPSALAAGVDLTRFAIPRSQWEAIAAWAANRATEWGTAAGVGFRLAGAMPDSYEDPAAPTLDTTPTDHRPGTHVVILSREAVDTIAACTGHVEDLAAAYGDTSEAYRHAVSSWLRCLTSLLDLALGAETSVERRGSRSLLVRTSSGLEYGVIFHPTQAPAHAPAHGRPGPTPATWCTHS
jgi:hypothetical protein